MAVQPYSVLREGLQSTYARSSPGVYWGPPVELCSGEDRMSLQSQLLRGDRRLEAAAISDPAHIKLGASGECVRKIQLALIYLDGAAIDPDGIYGPATAAAVLKFKQKRAIINRTYQTTADNIVGKMTIAAIDAELLDAEVEMSKRPRIVAVWPQARAQYPPASIRGQLPELATSARGAKSVSTKSFSNSQPQIIPGLMLELKVNSFGGFQVIDCAGGTVECSDTSIGMVSEPNAPPAAAPVKISSNKESFKVFGRGAGETLILAKKPGGLGGMLPSFAFTGLVVRAHSDKLTWRPTWNPTKEDRLRAEPWGSRAFGSDPVPGILVKSPLFKCSGSVDPDSTIKRSDFEVGILQTCLKSNFVAVYVNANGVPTWTLTIGCSKTPMRDAADESPLWYHKDDVKPVSAQGSTTVDSNDAPQIPVPWQTKFKKGTLVSTEGFDSFCTWLAVRQKSTGTLTVLCHAVWSVTWGCLFDFKTERRNVTGSGDFNSQGDDGKGPFTPVTTGKRVIDETTMTWTGPANG
jgi:hypothetical protein